MGVQGKMRDRMEKLVVLPFSMGCVSQASVAVAEQRPRRSKSDFNKSPSLRIQEEEEDEEGMKHSSRFSALPRPNLSTGVNRLVKGFKSLSQLFIYEDEMEELGMEMEMEMEIGCPTDVKHVTHIGWDGLANTITNPLMGWENLITPELLSHPPSSTVSLKQFEFPTATAAENDSPTFGLKLNTTSKLA